MTWIVVAIVLSCAVGSACNVSNECHTQDQGAGRYVFALDSSTCIDALAKRRNNGAWLQGVDAPVIHATAVANTWQVSLSTTAPSEGLELILSGADFDQMFQEGYQSWGFSGTVTIPATVPMAADGEPLFQAIQTGESLDEAAGVSAHAALFRRGDSGPVLVVAALSAERAVTGIAATHRASGTEISILYGPTRETLQSGADGTVASETLYIATADSADLAMAQLSTTLAAAHAGDAFVAARPPGGWFSWNQDFDSVTPALIADEFDAMTSSLAPDRLSLVEIDDGWELAWGEWTENSKFPDGLAAIATQITNRDLRAGIWMAPFLVDITSPAATEMAPSLFVIGADGSPLIHSPAGLGRNFYVLDGSNPQSMKLVTDAVARLAAAGFTFFKFDFLYAAALPGARSQSVTGIEALRNGLKLLRSAAGPGAILNACGAPILPVIGIADSLRVGPDTAYQGFDLSWPMVSAAARGIAARSYLAPLVWLDADQAQLRAPYSADEAHSAATVAALAGPAYALGDDLALLPTDRLDVALDPMILDLARASASATPVDVMGEPVAAIPLTPILDFRMTAMPPTLFHMTGASGTDYSISFDWMNTHAVNIQPEH